MFSALERVPLPPLEVHREPVVRRRRLADGDELAAAVGIAGICEIVVPISFLPTGLNAAQVPNHLLQPAVDFPLAPVRHGFGSSVFRFEYANTAYQYAVNWDRRSRCRPSIAGELRAQLPLFGPGFTK